MRPAPRTRMFMSLAVGRWPLAVAFYSANGQRSTANEWFNRRKKRLHINRLGDVPVAPRLQKAILVAAHGVRGEGEDRDAARSRVLLQLLHDAQPIDAGQ